MSGLSPVLWQSPKGPGLGFYVYDREMNTGVFFSAKDPE